jgi:hypothetical protein
MIICKIENCERKYYSKGYCLKHYMRFKKHGDPLFTSRHYHNKSKSKIYKCWMAIKQRCLNPNCKVFKNYGARNIKICARWMDFRNFYQDMGDIPNDMEIDRIDNDGNYEPGNCRWASHAENSRNRSCVKLSMGKANDIRRVYKAGGITQRALADIYDLTSGGINETINNKRWI